MRLSIRGHLQGWTLKATARAGHHQAHQRQRREIDHIDSYKTAQRGEAGRGNHRFQELKDLYLRLLPPLLILV